MAKVEFFGRDEMAERKSLFMNVLEGLKVEGYTYVGRTKKGHVFEELSTGAFVELAAVAKKPTFDFAGEEEEYLDAIKAREEREKEAERKRLAREAKEVREG
jgi:signal transduction histidine kinase